MGALKWSGKFDLGLALGALDFGGGMGLFAERRASEIRPGFCACLATFVSVTSGRDTPAVDQGKESLLRVG